MTRKRRFFIFFMSAGLMSILLFISLLFRNDDPLNNTAVSWLPENRVKGFILAKENKLDFTDSVECLIECHQLSKQIIVDGIADGDVEFSHDLTNVDKSPKTYYISFEAGTKSYYVLVDMMNESSVIKDLSLVEGNKNCNCKDSL
jgi:hypothetical protein